MSTNPYISSELIFNTEFLKSVALLAFLFKETFDAGGLLFIGALSIFLIAELDLGGNEGPLTISILEYLLVWLVNQVTL